MKFLVALSIVLGSCFAHAEDSVSGKIICSLSSPAVTGFELVRVRKNDRVYKGNYVVNDQLAFSGSYDAKIAAFKIEISTLDEDGEIKSQLLYSESNLPPGEFWHSKTTHESVQIDIYCHFIKD